MRLTAREAVILSILQQRTRRGKDIGTEYQERTKQIIPEGSLYTTLGRMIKKNLIQHIQGPHKCCAPTKDGLRKLKSFRGLLQT